MGEYNYSPAFLKAHEDLVRKLVQLAKDGISASARFETVEEARGYRNLVLNLKRSLAFNEPDYAFVHNALRTSTGRDPDGYWTITIGPQDQLRTKGKGLRGARAALVGIPATPPTLIVPSFDPFDIKDTAKMASCLLLNGPKEFIIQQQLPPEAANWFLSEERINTTTGLGFEVVSTTPFMHLRVVKKASA